MITLIAGIVIMVIALLSLMDKSWLQLHDILFYMGLAVVAIGIDIIRMGL